MNNNIANIKTKHICLKLFLSLGFLLFYACNISGQNTKYQTLYPICYGDLFKEKCGYINYKGKIIVEPKYKEALEFVEKTGVVLTEKDSYLVDVKGNIKHLPSIIVKTPFAEGLAIAKLDKKFVILNENGKVTAILPDEIAEEEGYYFAQNFSEGLAPINTKSNIGYIDKTGNFIIRPLFGYANDFHSGIASVTVNGYWGLINKKGEFIIKPIENDESSISVSPDGIARVQKGNNIKKGNILWEYYNFNGTKLLQTKYDYAGDFNDGLAVILSNNLYGYMNTSGKIVIPLKYKQAENFSEGLAAIEINKQYGFIDKKGIIIIKPQFEYIFRSFKNGLAYVRKNEVNGLSEGYIDRTGKWIWVKKVD